ncbi:MAG: sugar transferase [Clostridium sp.]|mgnify:FL=1|uniref:sugar transferase n=1 Tax=Clostridium sp. TaxID=1506 RepID=UPI0025FA7081|nr:sugar transferase [uncultured Clostridium sp.]
MENINKSLINKLRTKDRELGVIGSFYYKITKRIFDILFSLILLIVASPILIVSLIIVFLQDFKNPIFSQKRVGVRNEEFTIYKIRSMVHDAEKNGAKWAEKNDMRVTLFGKFIRKTRIDELPQLWNVIKGEMSLIGPRPELEVFYRKFEETIPNFRDRLAVKPGLAGWAQVNGGYDITPEEKLRYDLEYIDNLSFKLEIKILLKTIKVIFTGEGAR